MTDRINALVVTLTHDVREDDIEALVNAVQMLRGVADVSLNVADFDSHIAYSRARRDLQERLYQALKDETR